MTFSEVLIAILQLQSTWVSLNRHSELWPEAHVNQIIKSYSLGDPTQRLRDLFANQYILELDGERLPVAALQTMAEALKTNTSIEYVTLHNNQIEDVGASNFAEALKTNASISTLYLQNNQIGDDGASAIAEALKTNTSIHTLCLQNNQIGDDGARAIAEALKTNTSIRTLYLQNNQIGDIGASAIAEVTVLNARFFSTIHF